MIEIKNISKSFGSHIIFNDFSMKIDNNIFAVFTGESGCGKTSLLNMIGGIEPVVCLSSRKCIKGARKSA